VTPWCPSGYLGYSFLKFESHNKFIFIFKKGVYEKV
jgi:hypothetical protein